MNILRRLLLVPLLILLALSGTAAHAWEDEEDFWAPTPPRLSFIDGEVSHWREGADDWVGARLNLALAEGDALYTGNNSNFELQFDSRNFVRADENTQLAILNQEEHYIQFRLTQGLASFDIRSMAQGDIIEVGTPDAVFLIEQPGYYRLEVTAQETHFITRRGGRASLTTADGRSLSIYPSEDIVVTGGNPVQVATYAAPPIDAWDQWNDERSDRIGESVSARYLPPDVYGAEELDYYGYWRVVPDYGSVWIPRGVAPGWTPYSAGSWVWDPYYEWTWIDDAPWGWAPFHYGRWVYIGSYWAWTPGPVVRRSVYTPALVAFLVRDHDVSARVGVGLPGLWWVALSWGEPVVPWWGHHRHRWHPRWAGWGGPRIVNNIVIKQTTVINVEGIHYHNARLPGAILTAPADKFGRERIRATAETRYRQEEFAPVRGDLPVKPSRQSLFSGAPKATVRPPRDVVTRPVVATRPPRERALPWQERKPLAQPQADTKLKYVKTPVRGEADRQAPQRPPFGAEAGPERAPAPLPPRLREVASPVPGAASERTQSRPRQQETMRQQETVRSETANPGQPTVHKEAPATPRLPPPPVVAPPSPPAYPGTTRQPQGAQRTPPPVGAAQQTTAQPLPGKPANQTYRGEEQKARSWEQRGTR